MESHPPVESITFCRSSFVDNEDTILIYYPFRRTSQLNQYQKVSIRILFVVQDGGGGDNS